MEKGIPHSRSENPDSGISWQRKLTATILSVMTIAATINLIRSDTDTINPAESLSSEQPEKGRNLDIDNLKPGDKISFSTNTIIVDSNKLNVRRQPKVVEEKAEGLSNRWNLDGHKFTAVNPVKVGADINGTWWLVLDAEGKEYYFTGNNGGITNTNGNDISITSPDNHGEVVAVTDNGSVAEDKKGNKSLIATIIESKS